MVRPMLVLPYCSYVLCIIMTDNMVLPVKVIALLRCKYSTSHIKNRQRLLFSSQKLGSQDDLWFESKYMSPHYRLTNNNGWFDSLPPRWIWTQRDDKWAQKENDSKTRSTGSADTLQVNELWIPLNRIEKTEKVHREPPRSLITLFKTAPMKQKRFSVGFHSFQVVRTLATLWHFLHHLFFCFFIQNQSRLAQDKVTTIQKHCCVTHCITLHFEQLNEKLFWEMKYIFGQRSHAAVCLSSVSSCWKQQTSTSKYLDCLKITLSGKTLSLEKKLCH